MTEAEAWDSLAEHLKQKNYTGVLVLADWFQENGEEAVAVYLRWANKRHRLPEWDDSFGADYWYFWCTETDDTFRRLPMYFALNVVEEANKLQHQREWYSD